MATEQSTQHQHAQWLVSLATDHFVQQAIGSVAQDEAEQQQDSQATDDESHIVDMSGHTVVKLTSEAPEDPPADPPTPTSPFNLRRNVKKRKIEHEEPERHEFKLIRPKERIVPKQTIDMRRPVRPIDRQKMRPWLKNLLDLGSVFGLNWLQREEGVFQISWRHASRLGWNLETDGDVFERWARHTGIFKDGDEPEPKRWKANFRCALHSLPDVKELTSPTDRKGRNASRTYRFLRPQEVQPPVKRKQRYNIQIPYSVYENRASEDSGSPQGDSDDRNTDEESVVPEQVQAFPHCDHDYAIRLTKPPQEQTAEILSRHNSGYVLIKTKDAHEFEFRLTQPQQAPAPPPSSKKSSVSSKTSSPQKKAKGAKKKPVPSVLKKGKGGKSGQKTLSLKKDNKPTKKTKKSGETGPTSATKVSLKALLSGRKKAVVTKRGKSGPTAGAASKKTKKAKKTATPASKKKEKGKSAGSRSSVSEPQGLDALWKAANQIEGMDPITSAPPTAPTNTSSQAIPKRSTRNKVSTSQPVSKTKAATLLSKPAPSSKSSQRIVPTLAAPIVLAAHPVMGTRKGAALTPIPVLAPVPTSGAATSLPVSLSVLQKFLGLSSLQAPSPSSLPLTLLPAQVLAAPIVSAKTDTKKLGDYKTRSKRKEQGSSSGGKGEGKGVAPSLPTLMAQPEGTSMLKHLLRLTSPSASNTPTTPLTTTITPSTTTASTIIPSAPQVPGPFIAPVTMTGVAVKEYQVSESCVVKSEVKVDPTLMETGQVKSAVDQTVTNYQFILPQPDTTSARTQPSTDIPNIAVGVQSSTSQVCFKSEAKEVDETMTSYMVASSGGPMSSVLPAVSGGVTGMVLPQDGVVLGATSSLSAVPTPVAVTMTTGQPTPTVTNSVPQVTFCLPPNLLAPQPQVPGSQTMTLTMPQASVPAVHGQGSSTATFTHSMDLLQFLNLCAASGNGQVIIKTEPSLPADVPAANTDAQTVNSTGEGEASKFIMVNTHAPPTHTAMQVPYTHTTVLETHTPSTHKAVLDTQVPTIHITGQDSHSLPPHTAGLESQVPSTIVLEGQPGPSEGQVIQVTLPSTSTSMKVEPSTLLTTDSAALQATSVSQALSATVDSQGMSGEGHSVSMDYELSARDSLMRLIVSSGDGQAAQGVTTADMSLVEGGDGVGDHLMQDADIELTGDQHGADSFIVEDMLL